MHSHHHQVGFQASTRIGSGTSTDPHHTRSTTRSGCGLGLNHAEFLLQKQYSSQWVYSQKFCDFGTNSEIDEFQVQRIRDGSQNSGGNYEQLKNSGREPKNITFGKEYLGFTKAQDLHLQEDACYVKEFNPHQQFECMHFSSQQQAESQVTRDLADKSGWIRQSGSIPTHSVGEIHLQSRSASRNSIRSIMECEVEALEILRPPTSQTHETVCFLVQPQNEQMNTSSNTELDPAKQESEEPSMRMCVSTTKENLLYSEQLSPGTLRESRVLTQSQAEERKTQEIARAQRSDIDPLKFCSMVGEQEEMIQDRILAFTEEMVAPESESFLPQEVKHIKQDPVLTSHKSESSCQNSVVSHYSWDAHFWGELLHQTDSKSAGVSKISQEASVEMRSSTNTLNELFES